MIPIAAQFHSINAASTVTGERKYPNIFEWLKKLILCIRLLIEQLFSILQFFQCIKGKGLTSHLAAVKKLFLRISAQRKLPSNDFGFVSPSKNRDMLVRVLEGRRSLCVLTLDWPQSFPAAVGGSCSFWATRHQSIIVIQGDPIPQSANAILSLHWSKKMSGNLRSAPKNVWTVTHTQTQRGYTYKAGPFQSKCATLHILVFVCVLVFVCLSVCWHVLAGCNAI